MGYTGPKTRTHRRGLDVTASVRGQAAKTAQVHSELPNMEAAKHIEQWRTWSPPRPRGECTQSLDIMKVLGYYYDSFLFYYRARGTCAEGGTSNELIW